MKEPDGGFGALWDLYLPLVFCQFGNAQCAGDVIRGSRGQLMTFSAELEPSAGPSSADQAANHIDTQYITTGSTVTR